MHTLAFNCKEEPSLAFASFVASVIVPKVYFYFQAWCSMYLKFVRIHRLLLLSNYLITLTTVRMFFLRRCSLLSLTPTRVSQHTHKLLVFYIFLTVFPSLSKTFNLMFSVKYVSLFSGSSSYFLCDTFKYAELSEGVLLTCIILLWQASLCCGWSKMMIIEVLYFQTF